MENRLRINDQWNLVTGASYDWRTLLEAQAYVDPTPKAAGQFVNYPVANGDAGNVQGELIYSFSETGNLHASISDRARFPTLFDRFSTRFGSTISNPNLLAERAVNYEIGGADTLFAFVRASGAIFFSQIYDAIENVPVNFCDTTAKAAHNCAGPGGLPGTFTSTMQTQNVGNGKYFGYEASADAALLDDLTSGLRFSYIDRAINAQNPSNPPLPAGFHLTGAPNAQFFAYATWRALPQLTLTPSLQADSDRWTNTSSGSGFFKTGSFFLVNFAANYALTDTAELQFSARNLFDVNYQLVAGFPQEGRNFSLNLRLRS